MGTVPIDCLLDGWVHLDGENLAVRLGLGLRQLITSGLLAPGEQLPSERLLARSLHVSRPTVSAALDGLRSAGLLVSRQGSGTRVAEAVADRALDDAPFVDRMLTGASLNLAAAVPFDAAHVPDLDVSTADLLSVEPDHGVAPFGLPALRHLAAARLAHIGLAATADEVLVTAGAHHGLRTAFELLANPNSPVVVEEYTYGAVVDLARRFGANLIGLARRRDGVDPDELRAVIARTRPAFVLLATSIHSPTGCTTDPQRLLEIAAVLNRSAVPAVIDETYAELHYETRSAPLASYLASPSLTIESVSKTAWAGLRTGWIRASADLRPALAAAFETDLGQPVPSQLLTCRLLSNDYEGFLATRRVELDAKAQALRRLAVEFVPDWDVVTPDGGLTHWIDTGKADATEVTNQARRSGVLIAPGTAFQHRRTTSSFVRICHDRPEQLVATALERIAATDANRH